MPQVQRNAVASRRAFIGGDIGEALAQRGQSATRQQSESDSLEFAATVQRLLSQRRKIALAVALYIRLHGLDAYVGAANLSKLRHMAGTFKPKHESQIAVAVLGLASSEEERIALLEALREALEREGLPAPLDTRANASQKAHSAHACPWCTRKYSEKEEQPLWPSMVLAVAHQLRRGVQPHAVFTSIEKKAGPAELAHMRQSSTYRVQKGLIVRCAQAGIPLLRNGKARGKTELERVLRGQ